MSVVHPAFVTKGLFNITNYVMLLYITASERADLQYIYMYVHMYGMQTFDKGKKGSTPEKILLCKSMSVQIVAHYDRLLNIKLQYYRTTNHVYY